MRRFHFQAHSGSSGHFSRSSDGSSRDRTWALTSLPVSRAVADFTRRGRQHDEAEHELELEERARWAMLFDPTSDFYYTDGAVAMRADAGMD